MAENELDTFGKWLRANRRMQDLPQVELAQRVGCAEITIRKIEAGHLAPSKHLAYLLLNALAVPRMQQDGLVRFARQAIHRGDGSKG